MAQHYDKHHQLQLQSQEWAAGSDTQLDGNIFEMKVKKRLQRSPKQSPANKIQAINALYGSFGTLENMKRAAR